MNKFCPDKAIAPRIVRIFYFWGLLFSIFSLSSCEQSAEDKLNNKINIILRNGGKNDIDEQEWNNLVAYIDSNKTSFPNLLDNNKVVDVKKLDSKILDVASHRRNQSTPEIFNPKLKSDDAAKPTIKVFIDNSGSMDGYVRGITEFKAALSDLLVDVQYQFDKDNLKVNFINTKAYPSQVTEIKDFIDALEPEKEPYKIGQRTNTKLNEILKIILDSTGQNNISILVSDCIYSLEKDKDTEGALEFEKSLTKGAFLQKSKEFDFSTIVLKMKSKFNGTYWKKDNSSELLKGEQRPYYFWIIGSNTCINEFARKIKPETLEGFESSYYLSNFSGEKQPYYTVLKESNKLGFFKQTDRHQSEVRSIEEIKFDNNGQLQFAIAADLSHVPVDSTYLSNVMNYVVTEGFEVKSVEKIDRKKLSQRDMVMIENTPATHIITVLTTEKFAIHNFSLELSNQIPQWIKESSSQDDSNIKAQLDKTFGFSYLVEGVSSAYATQNPEQKSYLKLIVQINKGKTQSSTLSTILISLFAFAILIFIVLILLKRRNKN